MQENNNGGFYMNGKAYDMTKKMEVVFLELGGGRSLNIQQVATTAGVSTGYAHKVVSEFLATGTLEDPSEGAEVLANTRTNYNKIGPKVALFLLPLRIDDDRQLWWTTNDR
jgi:hypothetical protein